MYTIKEFTFYPLKKMKKNCIIDMINDISSFTFDRNGGSNNE